MKRAVKYVIAGVVGAAATVWGANKLRESVSPQTARTPPPGFLRRYHDGVLTIYVYPHRENQPRAPLYAVPDDLQKPGFWVAL